MTQSGRGGFAEFYVASEMMKRLEFSVTAVIINFYAEFLKVRNLISIDNSPKDVEKKRRLLEFDFIIC